MKRTLLSLILLFTCAGLKAQQYYPLLDSAVNRWTYISNYLPVRMADETQSSNCTYGPTFTASSYEHFTGSDTVLNSITYKTLYQNNMGTCLYGFIREDTALKKVFFRDVNNSPEVLLYDFSMQQGNTINISFINNNGFWNSGTYLLDSIRLKAIHHAAGPRRVFYLHCTTNSGPYILRWIEGIGTFEHIVYPYSSNQFSFGWFTGYCQGEQYYFDQFLTCFSHTQKVYYDSCARTFASMNSCLYYQDTCNYWNICSSVKEYNVFHSLELNPDPADVYCDINMELDKSEQVMISIFDITGKRVFQRECGMLAEGKHNERLDVSHLPDGFYFLECNTPDASRFRKLIVRH